MKWIKTATLILLVLTVGVFALYVASALTYQKVDYSTGTSVAVHKLTEEPKTYVKIESDTYIAEAVETGKRVFIPDFVQTADGEWVWRPGVGPSEWETKGHPQYIFWLPDGNYYFVSQAYADGIPEFYKNLSPPTETAKLLAIPWITLLVVATAYQVKRK